MNLANEPVRAISKAQQTQSKRLEPKQGNRTKFSPKVRKAIVERDKDMCVKCGKQANAIHHIIFRSDGGRGTEDNGCCICQGCHIEAHRYRKVREWFEHWRERMMKRESTN